MELRRLSAPLGDPFLAPLRRRHPDVDVVVLPPDAPPGLVEPVPDEVVRAARDRVGDLADDLWERCGPGTGAGGTPQVRWGYGAGPDQVRAVARVVTRSAEGFHVLVALRHGLEAEGWAVERPPGGVERLVAHLDDLTVTASFAEQAGQAGTLLLEVASASLPVGADRARGLTRAGGR